MLEEQQEAVSDLILALRKCSGASLQGGFYDNKLCLWTIGAAPNKSEDFLWDLARVDGVLIEPEQIDYFNLSVKDYSKGEVDNG